ncbi:ABC-type antimicrobial peptide transport system permease subunit [Algoriphagus sp. 4150]|uniref:ABC transporter permease n=1 Tax=Algoriphagus sp. 4150 TaxID=2817756 RepID=UPI0028604E8C|nr:ABC transporter permease [Algoriphagus sp. 4150]MDR7132706.1 ABC-type antimicrobial peptide transport system permease subunit [Algoriphagus sp. 4150]
MLRHNLLLIFRGFKKDKSTFFINLIGLSTGLACALLIFLWVRDELSFDQFHENDERLYQVMVNRQSGKGIQTVDMTPAFLAEALAEELPEVEMAVTTASTQGFDEIKLSIAYENVNLKEMGRFVGKDFFNMFSYELIQGDSKQVLAEKNSIVLSETLALKLFKSLENVVGKVVTLKVKEEGYVVSGVFRDMPPNSFHQFDFLISWDAYKEYLPPNWYDWDELLYRTYILLAEGSDPQLFNEKIAGFIKTKYKDSSDQLFIRPYSSGYLHGKYENGVQAGGRIEYVKLFSIIAVFILVIASINFMNLSTAKAFSRAKEVGIKKSMGAGRKIMILQYLTESLVITLFALVLSIAVVQLLLPQFNLLTGKNLSLVFDLRLYMAISGVVAFTGLFAGSYPALYLSGFNPALVLKGKLNTERSEVSVRKGLVVFQFALSVLFIVSVLVVYKQIDLIQTKNLGYDKDNVIYFDSEGFKGIDQDLAFVSELRNIPGVSHASGTSEIIVNPGAIMTGVSWPGKNPEEEYVFNGAGVMEGMIELLGIEIKEGRSFSYDFQSENDQIIINEAALELMGLKDPVGQVIDFYGNAEIVGVAKNFHFQSLYEEVKPFVFLLERGAMQFMVKLEAGSAKESLSKIEGVYGKFNPGYNLNYKYLDQDYQALYETEHRVGELSKYFAGIAIIISCLGLFGLAAFTAERRVKEIGIRKVLGSSVWGILTLLTGDFVKMVLIAVVVAIPISYYLTKSWLDGFAFKIDLEWWFFIGAGVLTLGIALLTVSFQSVKAALMNPVNSLKSE